MPEKKTQAKTPTFLTYKGKPLVRCANTLYYGNLYENYVIMMRIIDTVPYKEEKFAGRIVVQLMSTDINAAPTERIIKKTDKQGLYNAIDIASIWLENALAEA